MNTKVKTRSSNERTRDILDNAYHRFNFADFVECDPVSIPHRFSQRQDIEISALFTAILAWGQRKTIIKNLDRLLSLMDNSPYDFIRRHEERDLKKMEGFIHRTFNDTDLLYTIEFLRSCYSGEASLEVQFSKFINGKDETVENGLIGFRKEFVNSENFQMRSGKHVASPTSGSACKRLNMFLRWMVRNSDADIDFGLWSAIKPSQLVCPLDVHVIRVANRLGLLKTDKANWKQAVELTRVLKEFDPDDPVKYDIALFGLGIHGIY
jgi:uncharacterized protein (TIGR02757 family)